MTSIIFVEGSLIWRRGGVGWWKGRGKSARKCRLRKVPLAPQWQRGFVPVTSPCDLLTVYFDLLELCLLPIHDSTFHVYPYFLQYHPSLSPSPICSPPPCLPSFPCSLLTTLFPPSTISELLSLPLLPTHFLFLPSPLTSPRPPSTSQRKFRSRVG